jgi:hypothetical protein
MKQNPILLLECEKNIPDLILKTNNRLPDGFTAEFG